MLNAAGAITDDELLTRPAALHAAGIDAETITTAARQLLSQQSVTSAS